MKTTKLIVTQGLKWPPDVPAQIVIASKIPNAYAKPICNTAAGKTSVQINDGERADAFTTHTKGRLGLRESQ